MAHRKADLAGMDKAAIPPALGVPPVVPPADVAAVGRLIAQLDVLDAFRKIVPGELTLPFAVLALAFLWTLAVTPFGARPPRGRVVPGPGLTTLAILLILCLLTSIPSEVIHLAAIAALLTLRGILRLR